MLFKSILVIINIERQDSATCLAFHHNHLTVAYVFSLYFLQERYGKEETKNPVLKTQKHQVHSPKHNFSPNLLFICSITACRATFLSGSSDTLGWKDCVLLCLTHCQMPELTIGNPLSGKALILSKINTDHDPASQVNKLYLHASEFSFFRVTRISRKL